MRWCARQGFSFSAPQGEGHARAEPGECRACNAHPNSPAQPPGVGRGLPAAQPVSGLKNVACDCRDGLLVLRGCLPSYYLKQVAQEVVARLEGVQAIDNQIQVVPPASH